MFPVSTRSGDSLAEAREVCSLASIPSQGWISTTREFSGCASLKASSRCAIASSEIDPSMNHTRTVWPVIEPTSAGSSASPPPLPPQAASPRAVAPTAPAARAPRRVKDAEEMDIVVSDLVADGGINPA